MSSFNVSARHLSLLAVEIAAYDGGDPLVKANAFAEMNEHAAGLGLVTVTAADIARAEAERGLSPVALVRLCRCYAYQACDSVRWKGSPLAAAVDGLHAIASGRVELERLLRLHPWALVAKSRGGWQLCQTYADAADLLQRLADETEGGRGGDVRGVAACDVGKFVTVSTEEDRDLWDF